MSSAEHSTCKGPEVGQCLAGSQNGSEVHELQGVSAGMRPAADLCVCVCGGNKTGLERDRPTDRQTGTTEETEDTPGSPKKHRFRVCSHQRFAVQFVLESVRHPSLLEVV